LYIGDIFEDGNIEGTIKVDIHTIKVDIHDSLGAKRTDFASVTLL